MNSKQTIVIFSRLGASAVLTAMLACSDGDSGGIGNFEKRVVNKLDSCGLLETRGKLSDAEVTEEDRCEIDCLLNASCSDFRGEFCDDVDDESAAYEACYDECGPFTLVECETDDGVFEKVDKCDGYADCRDGRDEQDCPDSAFFECDAEFSSERIPKFDKCDGYEDCDDGSDEDNCPADVSFTCDNGERIPTRWKCDGQDDCSDGSEEESCPTFACKDGFQTVPLSSVCDLGRDCSDGSDEDQGCAKLKLSCRPEEDDFEELRAPLMSVTKSSRAAKSKLRKRPLLSR